MTREEICGELDRIEAEFKVIAKEIRQAKAPWTNVVDKYIKGTIADLKTLKCNLKLPYE